MLFSLENLSLSDGCHRVSTSTFLTNPATSGQTNETTWKTVRLHSDTSFGIRDALKVCHHAGDVVFHLVSPPTCRDQYANCPSLPTTGHGHNQQGAQCFHNGGQGHEPSQFANACPGGLVVDHVLLMRSLGHGLFGLQHFQRWSRSGWLQGKTKD